MKIAIVDDDSRCRQELETLCHDYAAQNHCRIDTVCFSDAGTFLDAFAHGGFSAVFLDIYMGETNGIAAAMQLRQAGSRCLLVFVTSATEFMPDAFACHAFDYVTKPFAPQRVFRLLADIETVLPVPRKYIELLCERKTIQIFLDEIVWVVTDAHYLDFRLADGQKLRSRMTMAEFTALTAADKRFLAVNKGIAVNAERILEFEDNCCVMENGEKLPIRVRDRQQIKQAARNYNFETIRSRQRYRKED